jgi:hypothetical protein
VVVAKKASGHGGSAMSGEAGRSGCHCLGARGDLLTFNSTNNNMAAIPVGSSAQCQCSASCKASRGQNPGPETRDQEPETRSRDNARGSDIYKALVLEGQRSRPCKRPSFMT